MTCVYILKGDGSAQNVESDIYKSMDYWLITQLHHCSEGELKYRGLSSFEVLSVNEYSLGKPITFLLWVNRRIFIINTYHIIS